MNQKLEPLNQNELLWIQAQLENASKVIERFSPSDSGTPLTLAALDRAFAAWLASEPAPADINEIINCAGIAFGQALVDTVGLNGWSPPTNTAPNSPSTDYPTAETSWSIQQISWASDGNAAKAI